MRLVIRIGSSTGQPREVDHRTSRSADVPHPRDESLHDQRLFCTNVRFVAKAGRHHGLTQRGAVSDVQPFAHITDNPPRAGSSDTDEAFACLGSDDHTDDRGTDVLILGRNRDTPQGDPVEVVHRAVERINNPADPRFRRTVASLFAHQPITRTLTQESLEQKMLSGLVHRRDHVRGCRLGLHRQLIRTLGEEESTRFGSRPPRQIREGMQCEHFREGARGCIRGRPHGHPLFRSSQNPVDFDTAR